MYLLESVTVTNRFSFKKIKLTFVTTMKLNVRHYSTKLCDNFVDWFPIQAGKVKMASLPTLPHERWNIFIIVVFFKQ